MRPAPVNVGKPLGPVVIALLTAGVLSFSLTAHSSFGAPTSPSPDIVRQVAVRDSLVERGRYVQALPIAERICEILLASHPELDQAGAEAMLALARINTELTQFDAADSLATRVLEKERGADRLDSVLAADAMAEIAYVRDFQGQVDEAIAMGREVLAIRVRRLGPDHQKTAQARLELSGFLGSARLFEESDQVLRRMLESFSDRSLSRADSLTMAQGMAHLGYLISAPANTEGEQLLQRAYAIQTSVLGPVSAFAAEALNIMGALLLRRGDLEGALKMFEDCLAMRRRLFPADHRLVRQTRNNCAVVLNQLGRCEESEPVFRELIILAEADLGPDHPSHTYFYFNLGYSLFEQERFDEAWEVYQYAADLRGRTMGEGDRMVTRTLLRLAAISRERGDYEDAELRYLEVVARQEAETGYYGWDRGAALTGLGLTLAARGDLAGAVIRTQQAVEAYEWLRLRSFGARHRATFMRSPYDQLAALNLELGREDEAWNAVVRASGLTLAELLRTSEKRRTTQTEMAREDSLASALADAEALLVSARRVATEQESETVERAVQEARRDVVAAEARWLEFRRDMARLHPVTEGGLTTLEDVQAQLDGRTAMIGWLDADLPNGVGGSWGFVVRRDGPVTWSRLELATAGGDAAAEYRDMILDQAPLANFLAAEDHERLAAMAHRVWRERFGPLEADLAGVTHLVCVPSPAMADVPVAALIDEQGAYLGDRYGLVHTPSISSFVWLERHREPGVEARSALLVGNPPFRPEHLVATNDGPPEEESGTVEVALLRSAAAGDPESLARLPRLRWADREMTGVGAMFPEAIVLTGPMATEDTLLSLAEADALAEYDVLHFATHALVDEFQPSRSALALSQVGGVLDEGSRPGLDGLVSAAEIIRQWRLDADLVTLSACRTALGRRTYEGTMGLASAFLEAGAGCLLVSLWNVDDEATARLVQRFYANWRGGMSKVDALQDARRELRASRSLAGASWDHPFYWSAFVLIGNAD